MKIFEYSILYHAGADEKKKDSFSKIIKPITAILAENEKAALILAAREIPEQYLAKLNQVEIAVRPF